MHYRAQRVYLWATTLDTLWTYFMHILNFVKTPLQAQNMHNRTQEGICMGSTRHTLDLFYACFGLVRHHYEPKTCIITRPKRLYVDGQHQTQLWTYSMHIFWTCKNTITNPKTSITGPKGLYGAAPDKS